MTTSEIVPRTVIIDDLTTPKMKLSADRAEAFLNSDFETLTHMGKFDQFVEWITSFFKDTKKSESLEILKGMRQSITDANNPTGLNAFEKEKAIDFNTHMAFRKLKDNICAENKHLLEIEQDFLSTKTGSAVTYILGSCEIGKGRLNLFSMPLTAACMGGKDKLDEFSDWLSDYPDVKAKEISDKPTFAKYFDLLLEFHRAEYDIYKDQFDKLDEDGLSLPAFVLKKYPDYHKYASDFNDANWSNIEYGIKRDFDMFTEDRSNMNNAFSISEAAKELDKLPDDDIAFMTLTSTPVKTVKTAYV